MIVRSVESKPASPDEAASRADAEAGRPIGRLLVPVAFLVFSGCAPELGSETSSWTTSRDTLGNGVVRVVNEPRASEVRPDQVIGEELRIGARDGTGPEQFGQIRGIAVLGDGRVAVLDALVQEVRVFDEMGAHRATFGGEGGGPGELAAPWGLMSDAQDRLWVPDHANDRMTVFDPDSGYVESYPMPVLSYAFIWRGAMLDDGRIVKPSITLGPPERREMLRVYGPEMEMVDSVLLPEPDGPPTDPEDPPSSFYWEASDGTARGYIGVPFYARPQSVFDPSGGVWTSAGSEGVYRLAYASLRGDTSLVIETRREAVPVPEAKRDSAIDAIREAIRERGGDTDQDWSKIPRVKPPVEQIFVSENGQLWVRTASPDSLSRFDVYDRDGSLLRTVVTSLPLYPYLRPIVRGNRFWAVVTDELDVQYVARGRIGEMDDGERRFR